MDTFDYVPLGQFSNGVILWRKVWGPVEGPHQSEREKARRRKRLILGELSPAEVYGDYLTASKEAANYEAPTRVLSVGYQSVKPTAKKSIGQRIRDMFRAA